MTWDVEDHRQTADRERDGHTADDPAPRRHPRGDEDRGARGEDEHAQDAGGHLQSADLAEVLVVLARPGVVDGNLGEPVLLVRVARSLRALRVLALGFLAIGGHGIQYPRPRGLLIRGPTDPPGPTASCEARPPAASAHLGDRRPEDVVGVDDPVRVALLGEEPLPVGGVLGVEGVARDHRVEVGLPAVGLGP